MSDLLVGDEHVDDADPHDAASLPPCLLASSSIILPHGCARLNWAARRGRWSAGRPTSADSGKAVQATPRCGRQHEPDASDRGQPILSDPRGLDAGLPFPQFSIHRGRLQGVLFEAVRARAGHGVIHVDHRLERFEQDDCGVRAHFVDRTGTRRTTVDADVLVGADGIHSAVRAQLLPDEGAPRWNGLTMWRGAADWPAFADGRTMIIAGGYAGKIVVYPIGSGRTGRTRLTNWALVAGVTAPGARPPRPVTYRDVWSQPGRREQVAPYLARLSSELVDLAGLVAATDPIYEYPMCDRDPIGRWSHGHVTLLGDAAHPMYPMGSNGATQAIIDAACLADHLDHLKGGPIAEALRAYERDRLDAVNRIVLMNRVGGSERVIDVVEEAAPDGFAVIDDVIDPGELRPIVAEYAAAGLPSRGDPTARRTRTSAARCAETSSR